MTRTRFSPPEGIGYDAKHYKGLLLAAALKPESIQLLLGSTLEEAKRFKEEARGRVHDLQARIRAARKV